MARDRKPTRDECIREAAPHLAALVLDARRREAETDEPTQAEAS
jgi:hypothetical protein